MAANKMTGNQSKPAVICISSHVARGTVGNRAAVLAFEILGFPVWSVPTVILPWHPGHGQATRIVPGSDQFAAFVEDLARVPWLGEVGGILTGYLGDADQAMAISKLIKAVREVNPHAIYVCDPVIGDNGGLYVPEATAAAIRDHLLPLADITTPNRFELSWLNGGKHGLMADASRSLPVPNVLVTSAMPRGASGNILFVDGNCIAAGHEELVRPPNGLGDLTAALFLANQLDGRDNETALARTTNAVFELLKRSMARGADELTLEADSACLLDPPAYITARELTNASLAELMC